jgi:hypothetical protein
MKQEVINIEISPHQVVIIEKVIGPLIFHDIKIELDTKTAEWVICRNDIQGVIVNWVEVARFRGVPNDYQNDD